ncbi:MAG: hypothetical protein L0312_00005, partial [Acidobacteria bacterium]|nr:hypothetical protein [Acidobacteriota bacterium]
IIIRAFRVEEQVCDTKRSIGGFRKDRSHQPGAGCASASPSSADKGRQNVQSQDPSKMASSPLAGRASN